MLGLAASIAATMPMVLMVLAVPAPSAIANPGFEGGVDATGAPQGWLASSPATEARFDYEIRLDGAAVHTGRWSGRIRSLRSDLPDDAFATLTQELAARPFRGRRLRLSGWLRSQDVGPGYGGLWLRVDGPGATPLAFDNMTGRGVSGTTGWRQFQVVLDVPETATGLALGALLAGHGTLWVDDVKLEAVDKSVPTTRCQCTSGG